MTRIQKYLSEQGICSRREAEALMKRGLVSINGAIVREMGVQIDPTVDTVEVAGQGKREIAGKTTIVLYKPRDITSSTMRTEGKTVYDLFPQFKNLNIVGRLDRASEGLLMMSDDGAIARAITGDHHGVEKEYTVSVREDTNAGRLKSLEPGVELEDGLTLPCKTQLLDKHTFRIILHEGRKHQIRRMCEYLHLTVVQLKRIRIGPVTLGNLRSGTWRACTPKEVQALKATRSLT
jgi:23S rRNA pseudouridine2605 synthase